MSEADIAVTSAAISLAAAVAAWLLGLRSLTSAERSRRQQLFAELRSWAAACADSMSRAEHMLRQSSSSGGTVEALHAERANLSSLIDQGRWFFPNVEHLAAGTHKEAAYRGFRQPALDALVYAYRVVGEALHDRTASAERSVEALNAQRRAFVSEVQEKLDPRKWEKTFEEITAEASA